MITARYSIWEHSNSRERSGTPAKVAREIKQTVEQTPHEKLPRYDWVIAHVWSYFKESPGTDENAEQLSQENATTNWNTGLFAGSLVRRTFASHIRVISPEEMVWRMRMKHDPSQTKEFMNQIK